MSIYLCCLISIEAGIPNLYLCVVRTVSVRCKYTLVCIGLRSPAVWTKEDREQDTRISQFSASVLM